MIARVRERLRVGITGLGVHVPERVLDNDELARLVDTTDEWIVERTGIRERRIAADDEAFTDIALPAARAALADAGADAAEIDLLVCATVTPGHDVPDELGAARGRARRRRRGRVRPLAGCTGFMYAVAQAYAMIASGLSRKALVVGGDVLSKILDWSDRSTLVLFGDGAGAVVLEPVDATAASSASSSAPTARAASTSGCRAAAPRALRRSRTSYVKMNGREVFKFATRVLVSSAEPCSTSAGGRSRTIDVYVPHQANKRIIDHAVASSGSPRRGRSSTWTSYGNTSSGSIPLALADAREAGRAARRRARADDRHGRRPDLGLGVARMDERKRSSA